MSRVRRSHLRRVRRRAGQRGVRPRSTGAVTPCLIDEAFDATLRDIASQCDPAALDRFVPEPTFLAARDASLAKERALLDEAFLALRQRFCRAGRTEAEARQFSASLDRTVDGELAACFRCRNLE